MKQVFKRAIYILCSAAMMLSTIAYANGGGCGSGSLLLESGSVSIQSITAAMTGFMASSPDDSIKTADSSEQMAMMPCCQQHTTPGMNTPCHCSVQSKPVAPRQNLAASFVDSENNEHVVVQPWHVNRFVETIAMQLPFLVSDTRLRAPPERIYILNCALLR